MSSSPPSSRAEPFTVVRPMNAHDALTVCDPETNATYHVVAYADTTCRDRLATLGAGTTVRLELRRAGGRANVWTATRVLPGTPPPESVSA